MKQHLSRFIEIFRGVIPEENTESYKRLKDSHEARWASDPEFKKDLKNRFESAYRSLIAQSLSNSGLLTATTIRHFLNEFNTRTWEYGLRKLPIMFNILESFFIYHKSNIYFELLEEEDNILSFFDFINFITSPGFKPKKSLILDYLQDNMVYHFNVGADMEQITFKTTDGDEFVIGGLSMVRRGNEVTIILITGLICDLEKISIEQTSSYTPIPGKEKLRFDSKKGFIPVRLNDNPKYWKTLAACRFDLESNTIDARYIAKELENSFKITTDEIYGFLGTDGKFINDSIESSFKNSRLEIEKYSALCEIAKRVLYLPYYFDRFQNDILVEDHVTEFKNITKNPIERGKYKNIPSKFKILSKEVYVLNRDNKFSPDRIKLREDLFKVECSGYWKKLNPDEIGIDKNGNQISGKTWITKTQSWFEAKNDELIVTNNEKTLFNTENAGYIYILRNPAMKEDIFKIGLTTLTVDERASQLSKTSVPDKFYKMIEWHVKDCYIAEKQIHQALQNNRIDPRREFFKIKMDDAIKVITEIIEKINKDK
ncbi:MAG: GIY-YIG nuclease family protein [Bacteroidales bacterium]|nr:GIY-YIG nuclease family protein [Bacteroidales bacterium]